NNPACIAPDTLRTWASRGIVELWGRRDDMPEVLAQAHVACLPSYLEGLPKSLIEAAACGLPIVTTDVPGCREVVRHGDNGLLVPARDSVALADAIRFMYESPERRAEMGRAGRSTVLDDFDQRIVFDKTFAVYRGLLALSVGDTIGAV